MQKPKCLSIIQDAFLVNYYDQLISKLKQILMEMMNQKKQTDYIIIKLQDQIKQRDQKIRLLQKNLKENKSINQQECLASWEDDQLNIYRINMEKQLQKIEKSQQINYQTPKLQKNPTHKKQELPYYKVSNNCKQLNNFVQLPITIKSQQTIFLKSSYKQRQQFITTVKQPISLSTQQNNFHDLNKDSKGQKTKIDINKYFGQLLRLQRQRQIKQNNQFGTINLNQERNLINYEGQSQQKKIYNDKLTKIEIDNENKQNHFGKNTNDSSSNNSVFTKQQYSRTHKYILFKQKSTMQQHNFNITRSILSNNNSQFIIGKNNNIKRRDCKNMVKWEKNNGRNNKNINNDNYNHYDNE